MEKALDLGINFWDTADFYGDGENEKLISRLLVPNRNKIFIATKFGFRINSEKKLIFVGSPAYIKTAVEASLKGLQIETIDLYYAHRLDPKIPVEKIIGAMSRLVEEGKVRYIGLSEASVASIRKAHAVHPIAALQNEYSLLTRDAEKEILPLCNELGITFVAFSPLSRGLMTNRIDKNKLEQNDARISFPRFPDTYWKNNRQLASAFAEIAKDKQCPPAQLALGWILAQDTQIIPIPGTKRRTYLEENAAAVTVELSSSELAAIESLLQRFPNTGARYPEEMEKFTNK